MTYKTIEKSRFKHDIVLINDTFVMSFGGILQLTMKYLAFNSRMKNYSYNFTQNVRIAEWRVKKYTN